jgi:hypothetical protein
MLLAKTELRTLFCEIYIFSTIYPKDRYAWLFTQEVSIQLDERASRTMILLGF